MALHVRANVVPGPQTLPISDQHAFQQLPESVQKAMHDFNGHGDGMLTAIESRISHLGKNEQFEVMRNVFSALGMSGFEILAPQNTFHEATSPLRENSLPARRQTI